MPISFPEGSYPSTYDKIMSNKSIGMLFMSWVAGKASKEDRERVLFLDKPPKGFKVYTEFLQAGAPNFVPIDGKLKTAVEKINQLGLDERPPLFDALVKNLEKPVKDYITKHIVPKFYETATDPKSKLYEYRRLVAAKHCEGSYGKVGVVTERLGMKNKDLVRDIMIAMYMEDEKATEVAIKKSNKASGLRWKSFVIISAISKQKGLAGYHEIKIDAKKLAICGFKQVNDKKLVKVLKDMSEAHLEKDKSAATKLFKEVQKIEPKDSPISKLKFDGLIKLLVQKDALPDYALR